MLSSIPFLQARANQQEAEQEAFEKLEFPILDELSKKAQNHLVDPMKNLREIHDFAKNEEEKVGDKSLRYLLRYEQIWAKAEYQLFYDLVKENNVSAASDFLTRNFNKLKRVKVTQLGFELEDQSQISFSYFKAHQYPDLFVSSIPNSAKRSRNLAIFSFKYELDNYYQTFSNEVKTDKELKLLDFIQGSVKVRETLLNKHGQS